MSPADSTALIGYMEIEFLVISGCRRQLFPTRNDHLASEEVNVTTKAGQQSKDTDSPSLSLQSPSSLRPSWWWKLKPVLPRPRHSALPNTLTQRREPSCRPAPCWDNHWVRRLCPRRCQKGGGGRRAARRTSGPKWRSVNRKWTEQFWYINVTLLLFISADKLNSNIITNITHQFSGNYGRVTICLRSSFSLSHSHCTILESADPCNAAHPEVHPCRPECSLHGDQISWPESEFIIWDSRSFCLPSMSCNVQTFKMKYVVTVWTHFINQCLHTDY